MYGKIGHDLWQKSSGDIEQIGIRFLADSKYRSEAKSELEFLQDFNSNWHQSLFQEQEAICIYYWRQTIKEYVLFFSPSKYCFIVSMGNFVKLAEEISSTQGERKYVFLIAKLLPSLFCRCFRIFYIKNINE